MKIYDRVKIAEAKVRLGGLDDLDERWRIDCITWTAHFYPENGRKSWGDKTHLREPAACGQADRSVDMKGYGDGTAYEPYAVCLKCLRAAAKHQAREEEEEER